MRDITKIYLDISEYALKANDPAYVFNTVSEHIQRDAIGTLDVRHLTHLEFSRIIIKDKVFIIEEVENEKYFQINITHLTCFLDALLKTVATRETPAVDKEYSVFKIDHTAPPDVSTELEKYTAKFKEYHLFSMALWDCSDGECRIIRFTRIKDLIVADLPTGHMNFTFWKNHYSIEQK